MLQTQMFSLVNSIKHLQVKLILKVFQEIKEIKHFQLISILTNQSKYYIKHIKTQWSYPKNA